MYCSQHLLALSRKLAKPFDETGVKSDPTFCSGPPIEKTNNMRATSLNVFTADPIHRIFKSFFKSARLPAIFLLAPHTS